MQHIEKQMANEGMKKANLEAFGLTNEDLKRIVYLINVRKNPLDELNLRGNNIDDEGAQILASLKNLRYLDVGINDISDDGVKYLIENTSFESLDLSANNLTDKAVEILLNSSKLTWVSVEKNRDIRRDNIVKLEAYMQRNSTNSYFNSSC